MLRACGQGDADLHAVASEVAVRAVRGLPPLDMRELGTMQRARGEPHPGARAWTLSSPRIERGEALMRFCAWLGTRRREGRARCGVASVLDSERGEAVAVVVADALADLEQPVPSRVRPGAWVEVRARLLVAAGSAKLVVLGPTGAPRTAPTGYDPSGGALVARFSADVPGRWLAQVVASHERGPMPVLEVEVAAGAAGAGEARERAAPGEQAAAGSADEADALARMLGAARSSEGLAPPGRDARLDALAGAHARAMMAARGIGHDLGQGDPIGRARGGGIEALEAGENVAHAQSVEAAHRALWGSPSHRANLLYPYWDRVGVGAARDQDGTLWVAQMFARWSRDP
jgi:uncharacterized protein YkwD